MAGNLTNAEEDRLLDLSLPTAGTNAYLALFTSAPGEAGGGTEVSGNGYGRIQMPTSASSGGSKGNSSTLTFTNDGGGAWGQLLAIGVFDAATAGTLKWYRVLSTSGPDERRTINASDSYVVATGALTFTLD